MEVENEIVEVVEMVQVVEAVVVEIVKKVEALNDPQVYWMIFCHQLAFQVL